VERFISPCGEGAFRKKGEGDTDIKGVLGNKKSLVPPFQRTATFEKVSRGEEDQQSTLPRFIFQARKFLAGGSSHEKGDLGEKGVEGGH